MLRTVDVSAKLLLQGETEAYWLLRLLTLMAMFGLELVLAALRSGSGIPYWVLASRL
jgi:hypothetical protein